MTETATVIAHRDRNKCKDLDHLTTQAHTHHLTRTDQHNRKELTILGKALQATSPPKLVVGKGPLVEGNMNTMCIDTASSRQITELRGGGDEV
jgi:hypothetical protein